MGCTQGRVSVSLSCYSRPCASHIFRAVCDLKIIHQNANSTFLTLCQDSVQLGLSSVWPLAQRPKLVPNNPRAHTDFFKGCTFANSPYYKIPTVWAAQRYANFPFPARQTEPTQKARSGAFEYLTSWNLDIGIYAVKQFSTICCM